MENERVFEYKQIFEWFKKNWIDKTDYIYIYVQIYKKIVILHYNYIEKKKTKYARKVVVFYLNTMNTIGVGCYPKYFYWVGPFRFKRITGLTRINLGNKDRKRLELDICNQWYT